MRIAKKISLVLFLSILIFAQTGCAIYLKAAKIKNVGWESENPNIHFSVFEDLSNIHGYIIDNDKNKHEILVSFNHGRALIFYFKANFNSENVYSGSRIYISGSDKKGTIVNAKKVTILGTTYKKGEIVFKKVPVKPELDLGEWSVKQ